MPRRKQTSPTRYKRNKVEIVGSDASSKWLMFLDLLLARLPQIIIAIVLLCTASLTDLLPLLLEWLKKLRWFMILFVVPVTLILLLSG